MSTSHDHVPAAEGPLAHDARVTAERSYLDGLAEAQRGAWERASGARPERTPKRLLVALSHSIERAVMSGPIEYPTVVVALFQRLRFLDREREVYERMAQAGVIVVVGFVEGAGHEPPRGVHLVSLRADEPLAEEWSVVAVGPRAGAFLVATTSTRPTRPSASTRRAASSSGLGVLARPGGHRAGPAAVHPR